MTEEVTVKQIGTSLGIIVKAPIARLLGWEKDTVLEMSISPPNTVTLVPKRK